MRPVDVCRQNSLDLLPRNFRFHSQMSINVTSAAILPMGKMKLGGMTMTKSSASIVILLLLVGVVGGFAYTQQDQVKDLSGEVANLKSDLTAIRDTVQDLASRPAEVVFEQPPAGPPGQAGPVGPAGPAGEPAAPIEERIAELYEIARQSVVGIQTVSGSGSGWVFDSQNHIVTNNHVVADVSEVEVLLYDGTILQARVIGKDPFSDLAVLEVVDAGVSLQPLPIGSSIDLKVGEPVIAIGNPFGLAGSVSSGIVSQKGRLFPSQAGYPISNMIQIDAAINPGNSGGPLINMQGEVVGVTTGTISNVGGFTGIGLAIPSDRVSWVIPALIEQGSAEHPWIGIGGLSVDTAIAEAMNLDRTMGLLVTFIVPDSPAEQARLRAGDQLALIRGIQIPIGGDVIVAVDGNAIVLFDDLIAYIDENKSPGDEIILTIIRDGREMEISLILGIRPPP